VTYPLPGSIAVVDLETACEMYGRELPAPLGRTRPVGSVWLLTRDAANLQDRLHDGDLRGVRDWVEAVARADVSVECRVHRPGREGPDLRLHGMRVGDAGFVAVQRTAPDGVDTVDIYPAGPAELAATITERAGLVGAGTHPRIAVTGCGDRLPEPAVDDYDGFGFATSETGSGALAVDGDTVVSIGTLRVRDGSVPETLQWVQVGADGDYLYVPDAGYAEPVDAATLRRSIAGLIGGDAADFSADGELSFFEAP
jgi:hypothetical protein